MANKRYIYISHPCVSGDCCFKGAKIAFATSRLIKSLKTVCYAQSLYESAFSSGAHDHLRSPPVLSWVRIARSLVVFLVFCRSLFCPFISSNFSSIIYHQYPVFMTRLHYKHRYS